MSKNDRVPDPHGFVALFFSGLRLALGFLAYVIAVAVLAGIFALIF